jgi:hypothetical protein
MAEQVQSEQDLLERIKATRDLFIRQGWKWLKEGWEAELQRLRDNTLTDVQTLEELHFRKGAASILHNLVHFEEYLDAVEKAVLEDREARLGDDA